MTDTQRRLVGSEACGQEWPEDLRSDGDEAFVRPRVAHWLNVAVGESVTVDGTDGRTFSFQRLQTTDRNPRRWSLALGNGVWVRGNLYGLQLDSAAQQTPYRTLEPPRLLDHEGLLFSTGAQETVIIQPGVNPEV